LGNLRPALRTKHPSSTGLQEALAHYAGNDPLQSQTVYLDAAYGMGINMYQLVRGYDCPATATYLNATEGGYTSENICIFEKDAGYPLARHRGIDYVSVIKNNVLVVRFISTLGNYDYLLDYSFYNDGSVEVTARASGYIEGAYYAKNDDFGYRIQDAMSGSMVCQVIGSRDFNKTGGKRTKHRLARPRSQFQARPRRQWHLQHPPAGRHQAGYSQVQLDNRIAEYDEDRTVLRP